MSRKRAILLYIVAFIVTAGVNLATGGFTNFVFCVLITLTILFGILYYLLYVAHCKRQPAASQASQLVSDPSDQDVSEENVLCNREAAGSSLSVQMNPPKETPRVRHYFLDNIKSFLTVIVVMHHITGAFVGSGWIYVMADYYHSFWVLGTSFMALNQSYFMCLFFFISGHSPTHSLHSF